MKKMLAVLMAAVLAGSFAGVCALAYSITTDTHLTGEAYDADGDSVVGDYNFAFGDKVSADFVPAGKKIYIEIGDGTEFHDGAGTVSADELADSGEFNFRLDRDKNGSLLDSVKLVTKNLDGSGRKNYIEIKLKETTRTEERKVTFDVYFKARHADDGDRWESGDIANTRFELWVDNPVEDGDYADIEAGQNVVFNPVSNERNTISWGADDDVACLEFEADDDSRKFYAKLSTKIDRDIYEEYGDPVNAELFFRTFVGSPSIDSTSRATLTLYNPWNDCYDWYGSRYRDVRPRDVHIYLVDSDGYLEDLTDRMTYADEDDTEAGIDGWKIRVRSLGTYVISDRDLELDWGGIEEAPPIEKTEETPPPAPKPGPAPAPTGSHDAVGVSVMLAAASATAFALTRKRR